MGRPRLALGRLGLCVAVALLAVPYWPSAPPAHAAASLYGTGSTWSQIAIDQWRSDVAKQGLVVNYQGVGSSQGRQNYRDGITDFGVSEIPFQPDRVNNQTGIVEPGELGTNALAKHPYAYLNIVAGGTAFMYHVDVAGKRVTDLRMSSGTIAKVFTGQIKDWSDPAITADYGKQLPAKPIKTVVRSDGSGTTAQFTAFLNSQQPSIWQPFCGCSSLLSYFPLNGGAIAQPGSDGVSNFVSSPDNDGTITYVEYGYAKQRNYPVLSLLNSSGFYVQPTPENVSLALRTAVIDPSDRTVSLDPVYVNPDPRAYPLSSYSYLIAPTSTAAPFSPEKGDALRQFILYMVCAGQQEAAVLGYAPLPPVFVQSAFEVVAQIPGTASAPQPPPLDQCDNPTIKGEFTPENAPPPPEDAKQGVAPGSTGGGGSGGGSSGGGSVSSETAAAAGPTAAGDQGLLDTTAASAAVTASPVAVPTAPTSFSPRVSALATLALVLMVVLPLLVIGRRSRRAPSG